MRESIFVKGFRLSQEGAKGFFVVAAWLSLSVTAQASFEASVYLPIEPGQFSTFRRDSEETTETVLPGFEPVNGVPTRVIEDSDGARVNMTNDALGARLHRESIFDLQAGGLLFDFFFTYSPPVKMLDAVFDVGGVFATDTNVLLRVQSGGQSVTCPLQGDSVVNVVDVEPVFMPELPDFGTFETVRTQAAIGISGSCAGERVVLTIMETTWLGPGLGKVRSDWMICDEIDNDCIVMAEELIDTNRELLPEPGSALQLGATFVMLLCMARSRGGDTCHRKAR